MLRDLVGLGCEVAVVGRGEESRARARAGGAAHVVPTIDELPAVAGVVVVTPTTTHAEVIGRLLDRGVPIYAEKPLTADVAAAQALLEQAGDRIFVMHKWRYHPAVEALAAIARNEELGPVTLLRSTRIGWGNPHGDVDGVWMLAPHDISIVLEVFGEIPVPQAAMLECSQGMVTGLVGFLGDGERRAVIDVSIASSVRRREIRLVCGEGVAVVGDSVRRACAPHPRAPAGRRRAHR